MKTSKCYHCEGAATGRRDFLRVGALSFLGLSLSEYLQLRSLAASQAGAGPGKAQACILLWLEGGISHVDSWDVKGDSGFKPFSTSVPGIQISEIFPKVSRHMDKLSIIRSVTTKERNHPQGTIETLTGHRPTPAMRFPSFGSIVSKELGARKNMPPCVAVPTPVDGDFFSYEEAFRASFLGAEYDSMILPDPSLPDFRVPDLSLPKSISSESIEDRRSLLKIVDRNFRRREELAEFKKMDTFQDQALQMILSPHVRNAFDLTRESEQTRDRYGRHRVGQSLLLARRLVEAGCRFVTAAGYKQGQWDTHQQNNKTLREALAPTLDQCLSTLLEDLDQRGLLESTVVIVTGEFGRTPHINPAGGRDHWPECWSLLVGGGGIEGGQVVGASDEAGAYVGERPVSIGDLYATIYKAMGIDWTKTYMAPVGRPIYIANGFEDRPGSPIKELI